MSPSRFSTRPSATGAQFVMTERPEHVSLQMREIKSEDWFHERPSSGWMEISQRTRGKGIGWRTPFAGEEMGYATPSNSQNRFTVDRSRNALFASDKLIPVNASSQFCRSICTATVAEGDRYQVSHAMHAHLPRGGLVIRPCNFQAILYANFKLHAIHNVTIKIDKSDRFQLKIAKVEKHELLEARDKFRCNSQIIITGHQIWRKLRTHSYYFCIKNFDCLCKK